MPDTIRLVLSVDHQKKKTVSLELPYALYLQIITSQAFEDILPSDLQDKCKKMKATFLAENKFFSDDYRKDYEKAPYIRFLCGPDVHKFFAKVLSMNYQSNEMWLNIPPGSFEEYFADFGLFWNEKYKAARQGLDEQSIRAGLFSFACIQAQFHRLNEKRNLRSRLGAFAKQELAEKDSEIKKLKEETATLRDKLNDTRDEATTLKARLAEEQEKKIVLVPSDPHYMLGLAPGSNHVEDRAKTLMKALHPDKTGSQETAYLFDMVLKARDMIQK